jgi:sugar phosphate isomerase/epimerase
MMRSAVTVSLVPQARGGPFVFWDGLAEACHQAATLGFSAIEIFPLSADAIDRTDLHTLLRRHGLKVAAFGTGAGWVVHKWHLCHSDAAIRAGARDFIRTIIDLAAEFEAPAIIGSMQGRIDADLDRENALAWLRDALHELGAHAALRDQPLLYEPLNRYETNVFNRINDACAFLHTAQTHNVKILADLFHMNIEEPSIAEAIRTARGYIGHVHFADSNRRAMGCGHIAAGPIIRALQEIGYDGYLSAEVLPLPDPHSAARQTISSFKELTAATGMVDA